MVENAAAHLTLEAYEMPKIVDGFGDEGTRWKYE